MRRSRRRRIGASVACCAVLGLLGCGVSSHRGEQASVGHEARSMLASLEGGRYVQACEDFSVWSRYALSVASALDGHEADDPCADVFVMSRALERLGLDVQGRRLAAAAFRAGLGRRVELTPRRIGPLYRGVVAGADTAWQRRLTFKRGRALLGGHVVAVAERGRWLLEVNVAKRVPGIDGRGDLPDSCRTRSDRRHQRMCELLKAVKHGKVLSGTEHREFKELLPPLRFPTAELRRAFSDHLHPGVGPTRSGVR